MCLIKNLLKISVACSIFLAACSEEARMDTSSESAARASLLKMTSGMSQKEREDFNDAIYGIIKFAKDEMSKQNGAMTREEASAMLEGKTAKEIIELHKSLARKKRVPRYTR